MWYLSAGVETLSTCLIDAAKCVEYAFIVAFYVL